MLKRYFNVWKRTKQTATAFYTVREFAWIKENLLETSLEALRLLELATAEQSQVKNVPDGDGLRLVDGRRVRYLGLDAPEVAIYGHPPQPYALTSKRFNNHLVVNRMVMLVPDGPRLDRHGRLLRHVFVQGRWINAAMLLAGLAKPYRLDALSPPVASLLRQCANLARERGIGLWRHP